MSSQGTEDAMSAYSKDDEVDKGAVMSDKEDEDSTVFECPVCLQTASFPVQLPCRHIFCFLCVKGAAHRSKRCALCRQEIPADFFNDPKLLCTEEIKEMSKSIFDEGYQWFYEGRNGWWQYDERTSVELESKYKKGDKVSELLIAGFLYVIDLENMRQFRRNDQHRRRRIRRDLRSIPGIKGIAGLKYNENQTERPSGDGGEGSQSSTGSNTNGINSSAQSPSNQPMMLPPTVTTDHSAPDDSYLTPPAPNNTPQTPMTPADSQPGSLSNSQEDLSLHLQTLHLNSNNSARGSPTVDQQQQTHPSTHPFHREPQHTVTHLQHENTVNPLADDDDRDFDHAPHGELSSRERFDHGYGDGRDDPLDHPLRQLSRLDSRNSPDLDDDDNDDVINHQDQHHFRDIHHGDDDVDSDDDDDNQQPTRLKTNLDGTYV